MITKGIENSPSFTIGNTSLEGYTELVDKEFVNGLPESFFPSLFQESLDKEYELRIFFIEDQYFASAIFSQSTAQTMTDMRKYKDDRPNRVVPYVLPKQILQNLKKTMKSLQLTSGSIDMIVDTKGSYYFLEVNPTGQFGMVSVPCNYRIEKQIASVLYGK